MTKAATIKNATRDNSRYRMQPRVAPRTEEFYRASVTGTAGIALRVIMSFILCRGTKWGITLHAGHL
jgi:hypothetical protein